MTYEIDPYKRPRIMDTNKAMLLSSEKQQLSRPIEGISRSELKNLYPNGFFQEKKFIVADNKEKIVFNKDGREIEHTIYRQNDKPKVTELDVEKRVRIYYDEEGYLQNVTHMEFGKYGVQETYVYKTNENGSRELIKEIDQKIGRSGFMEAGKPVGEPLMTDFSNT